MVKKKLWSFGCSHSAGMCLTKKVNKTDLEYFYKREGAKDWSDFHKNQSIQNIERIYKTWYKSVGKPLNPSLSFAGQLAAKMDLEFYSYAYSGSGLDRILYNFLEKENEINFNKDIVLIEIPPVYRYMLRNPGDLANFQYAISLDKKATKIAPSFKTLEIFYTVGLEYIKMKHSSVHFINIRDQDIALEDLKIKPLNNVSLEELNEQLDNPRYPSGHYWYETHEKLAEHLKENL